MTLKALLGEWEWKRCPSVTPGGKPFFYFRRDGDNKVWVVWDRLTKKWKEERE